MKERDGINCDAVVLWRRKHKTYSTILFLTKQKGILACAVSQREWQCLKNTGYMQPFGVAVITLIPDGDYFRLRQIDGVQLVRSVESDLDSICYAAVAGEMIAKLFPRGEIDLKLYDRVLRFATLIRTKPVPLATILLGWQLMALAGYVPTGAAFTRDNDRNRFLRELQGATGFSLTPTATRALGEILRYDWSPDLPVTLPKSIWQELEKTLFAFCTVQCGEELESFRFLRTMGAKAF